MITLSSRSERNLVGVHPDLVRVVRAAAAACPPSMAFIVIEGRRSLERQVELIRQGLSRIKDPKNGRHVTGHAVDMVTVRDGVARWDMPTYRLLAVYMRDAAKAEGVDGVQWGGECFGAGFVDAPHWQLSPYLYPADVNLQPAGEVAHT